VRWLHVAPIARELDADAVEPLRAAFVGLSPQGWLRELEVGAPVRPARWSVPEPLLARADALVVSEEDLVAEPGAVEWLRARVPLLVVTRGPAGATAYAGPEVLEQPALPADAVDPTGAGDVFAAALFVRLHESGDLAVALRFAAAAAALAVEAPGTGGIANRKQVETRLGGR
jgi:sugar/nucleoside kinase (ribokinase family)